MEAFRIWRGKIKWKWTEQTITRERDLGRHQQMKILLAMWMSVQEKNAVRSMREIRHFFLPGRLPCPHWIKGSIHAKSLLHMAAHVTVLWSINILKPWAHRTFPLQHIFNQRAPWIPILWPMPRKRFKVWSVPSWSPTWVPAKRIGNAQSWFTAQPLFLTSLEEIWGMDNELHDRFI